MLSNSNVRNLIEGELIGKFNPLTTYYSVKCCGLNNLITLTKSCTLNCPYYNEVNYLYTFSSNDIYSISFERMERMCFTERVRGVE